MSGGATIVRSVLANWAGQVFFVLSGFILPRFVKDELGPERLGVWDLGWSTVAYLTLLNAGIASSVNRYVARARAVGDWEALGRHASCCACIFLLTSTTAAVATGVLAVLLPGLLPETFAAYLPEARWVVACLGLTAACGLAVAVFNGVLTGYQRYDLVMYIETGAHAVAFSGTLVALLLGYGLRVMGLMFLLAKFLECVGKVVVAYRICPKLHLSPHGVTRAGLWEMAAFGGKYFFDQISRITLYQGNNLLIAMFLGPASLAVYARAMALIQHANKLLFEFGRVLIPSASALQAHRDEAALERLILQSARYSLLIALPIVAGLTIVGDSLMRVWMGRDFAEMPLLTVLAVGHLAPLAQTGPFYVLLGLNRHGVPALSMGVAAALSITTSLLCLGVLGTGVTGVAWSVGGSVTAAYVLVTPWVISRASGLSLRRYVLETVPGAMISVLPFALALIAARVLFAPGDKLILLASAVGGGGVLLASYWRSAVPHDVKQRITTTVRRLMPRATTP